MTRVSELLRQADPLVDDTGVLEADRNRIRRTVIAGAADRQPLLGHFLLRRRILLGGAAATLIVAGVLFGSRDAALSAAVRFEARLAETQPAPGLIVAEVGNSGRLIYLHSESLLTNDDIAQSWAVPEGPDRFSVSVVFHPAGAQRMREATAAHVGRPIAILIDGKVVTAPVLRSAIGDAATITGDYNQAAAERIAAGIGIR